jgi:septum formation protein
MKMRQPILHLASSSPRRREILEALGVPFSFAGVDIDETRKTGEPVADMVLRLALEKSLAGINNGLPSLGADTVVVLGEQVFGKPESMQDALQMIAALSGQAHRVLTAVALARDGSIATALSDTEVRFRDIHPDEAHAYWQSGEPQGKAGGYAIQGLGGVFVESLAGSYSGVVGLPVFETAQLLAEAGIGVILPTDAT